MSESEEVAVFNKTFRQRKTEKKTLYLLKTITSVNTVIADSIYCDLIRLHLGKFIVLVLFSWQVQQGKQPAVRHC